MKELSIEEKAKAYDEALKAAIAAHKDEDRHLKATLERIFPELQESEDERIRKGLIKALSSIGKRNWGGIDVFESISWLEKQGEHKLTDKIEPKFHEGEWITNGDYTWKIVEVKPLDYILQSQEGNIVDDTISHVDEQFHSFTIKDAKDGDVLVSDNSIFIFQEEYIAEKPIAYCGLMNGCFLVDGEDACWTNEKCYPATKEQRDLLFQKMKEAGYEWDKEKKELKKIEQKPTQVIKPFEAEHGKYYYCIKDYFCGGRKQASKGDVVQALRGLPIMGLKDASEYFLPVNFIKCNSAWSEEDEKMMNSFLHKVEVCNLLTNKENVWIINKLKSLNPQSKQQWSEEDENRINHLIAYFEDKEGFTAEDDVVYANWLNSLKDKYTWKPSDEQMKLLREVQQALLSKDCHNRFVNFMYELKNLKEE